MARRQVCGWHWLATQPAAVQTRAARDRFLACPPERRARVVPMKHWPAGHRWCSGCMSMVPLFYTRGSRCVACSSAADHARAVEKKYGISIKEYNELLAIQGGVCAICGRRPGKRRLAVDHDHQTGEVRGLLCASNEFGCNKGLGFFGDDVATLRRAVSYLEAPPALRLRSRRPAP